MPGYEYQPLQPGSDEIRLLHVHPAKDFNDDLICDLCVAKLGERPKYAALSYVWGSSISERKVSLNGHAFSTTASLEYALRQFRTKKQQMLWADAICIDQRNAKERSQQVQLMRQIYSQALEVFISLGGGGPRAYDAISLLTQLFPHIYELLRPEQNPGTAVIDRFRQSPGWTELNELLKHPWYLRTWVFQEAVAGPEGTVMFNRASFPWIFFSAVVYLVREGNMAFDSTSASVNAIREMQHGAYSTVSAMNEIRQYPASWPLIRLLHVLRPQNVTDPRDKIYGILGVASDRVRFPSVNYEKPVEAVYFEYAQAIATGEAAGGALNLLLGAAGLQYQQLNLPSWVPDWSNPVNTHERTFTRGSYFKKDPTVPSSWGITSDTGLLLIASSPVKVELQEDRLTLIIRGYVEDSIIELGPDMAGTSEEGWLDFLSAWEEESGQLVMGYAAALTQRYTGVNNSGSKQVTRHVVGRYASVITGNIFEYQESDVTRQYSDRALESYTAFAKVVGKKCIGNTELALVNQFASALLLFGPRRRLCVTKNGRVGLVPDCSVVGDVISVLDGVLCHMILRRRDNAYVLVGDACMEGPWPGLKLEERASEFEDIAIQ